MSTYEQLYYDANKQLNAMDKVLQAAKLLEAELASALEIARGSLETCAGIFKSLRPFVDEQNALTSSPSAALAERDRAIEKRTANRALELADKYSHSGPATHAAFEREFGLKLKPEGE